MTSPTTSVRKTAENHASDGFNLESTNSTHTSPPTYSHTGMTSLATSGRHLLKFEKTAENVASDGFGLNFRGVLPVPPTAGLLVTDLRDKI